MGNRLSKIYTRTGDNGTTGLADGRRLPKDALRIEAIGTVDELNSAIGVALSRTLPERLGQILGGVQHRLFDLGGELSLPEYVGIRGDHVDQLERWLDELNAELPLLKEFILPAGCAAGAHLHLARAVCRRAERVLVSLSHQEALRPEAVSFVNRLSDLLFVASRVANRHQGQHEVYWQKDG